MSTVFVVGHRHPDNDAILSAVVLSQLLNARNDGNSYVACRAGEVPRESAAILESWGEELPLYIDEIAAPEPGAWDERQQLILVDHNDELQSPRGIRHAHIIGVVDHHRISGFSTSDPLSFLVLPWGSTCSIIYKMFEVFGIEPSVAQLCFMLSAIMTDTIMMKSPTTTEHDRATVQEIAERLGVDPLEFGMNIFLKRADARPKPQEIVEGDVKTFEIDGRRMIISKYETINKDVVLEDCRALRLAMDDYRRVSDCDTLVLVITDIVREGSQIMISGNRALPERALGIHDRPEGVWLPGIMSRKKQVVAPILVASAQ